MAQYEVTSAQLKQAMSNLSSYNEQFLQRVADLVNKQGELSNMWQGDAKNTFDQAFNNDKDLWQKFAQVIQQYIEALGKIAELYEKAEAANVETAKNRTY